MTDRRRLCPGARFDAARRCLVEQARRAVEAGIDLMQIRERDLEAAELCSLVSDVVRLTRATAARVVVNDRLDVALAAGADGVHLRADSLPTAAVRSIAPAGFLIGRSVHRLDEAVHAALDVDYLIAGTVFSTPSKPGAATWLGVHGLSAIASAVPVPVLAIGGISIERVGQVAAAGAAGIAAIGLFLGDQEATSCRAVSLLGVARAVRGRFDSVKTAS